MAPDLTPDQIEKLKLIGILKKTNPTFPLLSISGITLLSFSGLILLKSKAEPKITPPNLPLQNSQSTIEPTQVPKSIQHYLLTSQQYFSQALQLQQSVGANHDSPSVSSNQQQTIALLNQSILAATEAIKEFPSDYRGYYQRAKIYQSLSVGADQFIDQTISDLSLAYKYNSNSAEITHDLASIYAKKGDAKNTLAYLTQTVSLDPTKAQNFYDLAKIQQQTGQISQAVDTYNRLIPLITDVNQKAQVEQEKASLEKLASQAIYPSEASAKEGPSVPNVGANHDSPSSGISPPLTLPDNPPTIQAMNNDNNGLIIAAPETESKVEVQNLTDSNALSGTATLPANQKDITITNSNLTSESQVYLSLTKGGKNQTLKVLSKSADSFIAGFDTPLTEEVEFKWWIISK
ncbi:MAG: tetratricopeptide repeat protein [Candidatus Shapirobacteria bacterium]|nr:tetratricopeptide repeat protein [Candidatus Shapirobacteria bacterium]